MSLYTDLIEAGCAVDNHESDLYVKATAEAAEIIKAHGKTPGAFISEVDSRVWWEVPFAYDPWWSDRAGPEQEEAV